MEVCRRAHNIYDLIDSQRQAVAVATANQTTQFLSGFAPNGAAVAAIGNGLSVPLANQVRQNEQSMPLIHYIYDETHRRDKLKAGIPGPAINFALNSGYD